MMPVVVVLAVAGVAAAQTGRPGVLSWSDGTRDVYIGGDIDRSAQVLFLDSPNRIALISPRLDRAVVLDLTEQTVGTIAKDAFKFSPDRTSATTETAVAAEKVGKYVKIDATTYLVAVDNKPILIRTHPGLTGEITQQKLLETVPVWHALMDQYQPASDTVASIKQANEAASLTVVLGSWCSDSKNYVPKLLKTLRQAGNDKLKVRLIGVDNQFHTPLDTIQNLRVTNVPTVIVERGGREIGRIVETPATDTIEKDLAAILSGKSLTHPGRWDRGPKIAEGVYSYKDAAGKECGTERWELFSTSEKGHLLHSLVTTGDVKTEIWHRVDANRKPTMVEITRSRGRGHMRTRYRFGERNLSARLRGSESGVIEQTLSVPDHLAFTSQAIAAEAWGWAQGQQRGRAREVVNYVAPAEFDDTVGVLETVSYEAKPDETTRVPAGEFRARHIVRKTGKGESDWWLHSDLGIPVRGKTTNGLEYVLTSLEIKK